MQRAISRRKTLLDPRTPGVEATCNVPVLFPRSGGTYLLPRHCISRRRIQFSCHPPIYTHMRSGRDRCRGKSAWVGVVGTRRQISPNLGGTSAPLEILVVRIMSIECMCEPSSITWRRPIEAILSHQSAEKTASYVSRKARPIETILSHQSTGEDSKLRFTVPCGRPLSEPLAHFSAWTPFGNWDRTAITECQYG